MHPIKVLIAEDKKQFRQGLISYFRDYDFLEVIAEAENGRELLKLLNSTNPDVVLLDLSMPEMDGDQSFEFVMDHYPGIKIIILTNYDERELIKNYITRGARAYVTKNDDYFILLNAIKQVHETGYYYNNIEEIIGDLSEREQKRLGLKRREIEIIRLMCEGKTNKQIATELCIEIKTVEAHRKKIYQKTGTDSLPKFIAYAIKRGLNFLRGDKK